ncbi:MAG: hypothetical protein M0Z75_09010, partial [Nitrospiraceae bacterium]|nr:hypothetical protein [Nitrospiraceae bacterium]
RCCGVIHCMSFWGKYGASVATSGGGGEEAVTAYMNQFLIATGTVPVGAAGANMSAMPEGGFTEEVKDSALALGKELVLAWKEGGVPPEVAKRRDDFRRRMLSLIAYRKDEWPYEFQYWKTREGSTA